MASNPTAPPSNGLSNTLGQILDRFGVQPADTRGRAEEVVTAMLAERGHDARVAELRWGSLVLEAAPAAASLLRFDRDMLLAAVEAELPGVVTDLRVRTVRRR